MTSVVTVYSREGCHLCAEAIAQLEGMRREGLVIEVVDIDEDDALLRRYLERIPVVALDGAELYELHVDLEDLARRLDAAAGR